MALPKLYEKITWVNDTTPALNEDNLNEMSQALEDIDDRVIEVSSTVMETVPELQDMIEEVEQITQNPPYIGDNGDWYVWDTSTNAYVDSGVDASITVTVGTTTTLPVGSDATVTNTGTNTDPILNFGIPQGTPGVTPQISATASVNSYTGTPSVTVTKSGTDAQPSFAFAFENIKGQRGAPGADGSTPQITATATVDGNVGTPSVTVTQGGTTLEPTLAFAFSNLKGATGSTGATGATPDITMSATADATSSSSPSVNVTKGGTAAAPTFGLAFSGLKGSTGATGATPNISASATVDSNTGTPSVTVTRGGTNENPTLAFAFSNLKGADGSSTWSGISNKPFSSVGNGLTVSSDTLTADVKSVSVGITGTASASAVSYQRIGVNGSYSEIKGTKYMEQSVTLSTSADVTATFTNAAITTTSAIDVYTSDPTLTYKSMSISSGSCTVTFDKQASASTISVRIYIK